MYAQRPRIVMARGLALLVAIGAGLVAPAWRPASGPDGAAPGFRPRGELALPQARAQERGEWDAPYCGDQSRITSVFDHAFPNQSRNGQLILYSGVDLLQPRCSGGLGYDGHEGWDYARRSGSQACGGGSRPGHSMGTSLVYAAKSGTVTRSRWVDGSHESSYGLHLVVDHGEMESLYGHLAGVFVEEGQGVTQGQLIAALGTTGNSTAPHLHFGAARGDPFSMANTFDVYGWNKRYGPGYEHPGYPDPHRGDGWSVRKIVPGQNDKMCPSACGETIIDDDSPEVVFGCNGGGCPHWYVASPGYGGRHHWTYANGPQEDYWAEYSCRACGPGTFLIEAYIPYGANVADTHVARYEAAGRVTILDQHEEGNIWHPLGVFAFGSTPRVKLSDRTDRYNYTARAPQKVGADALRFRKLCGGIPPSGPPEPGPGQPTATPPPGRGDPTGGAVPSR